MSTWRQFFNRLVIEMARQPEERGKQRGFRNVERFDLALEVLSALQPAPADAQVLREIPPVGIRYPAPVIPGRTS